MKIAIGILTLFHKKSQTMSEQQNAAIEPLRHNVTQLIQLFNKIKEEKEQLVVEKLSLMRRIDELTQQVDQLSERNKVLELAKSLAGNTEDSASAKKKIDGIIREIDKCMALLNQ